MLVEWNAGGLQRTAISMHDSMDVVLNLRGSNVATVKDVLNLGRVMRTSAQRLENQLDEVTIDSKVLGSRKLIIVPTRL